MLVSLIASVFVRPGAIIVSNNLPATTEQLRDFAKLCGERQGRIVVIDCDPLLELDPNSPLESLRLNGFHDLEGYRFEKEESELNPYYAEMVGRAKGIVVVGHDGANVQRLCNRDARQNIFRKFIESGGIFFGIGPGATAVGDKILIDGKTMPGLSIFDGIITTDYFAKHKELSLRKAYFGSRLQLGVGLNKDEWMIFRDGLIEKKVGSPQVFLRE